MTSIAGAYIKSTPCCGKTYSTPRYRSMNFMAWEYWTDGYRDGSLMPNDHGLRRCQCGDFYLVREMQVVEEVEETDVPYTVHVQPNELHQAIAQARNPAIELAARLQLWQHLNHAYREVYREHRKAEEAATQAQWEADNPDPRSWWKKLLKVPAPKYERPVNAPFTYPPFDPTDEQRDNMKALLPLVNGEETERVALLTQAELHRELGQFDQADQALQSINAKDDDPTYRVIRRLVTEKQNVPMRYRM